MLKYIVIKIEIFRRKNMAKKEKKSRKKSTFFKDFKDFATRGNVLDMAVGVVIGGAFGKIISSLVADIIMPIIGIMIGGFNIAEAKVTLREAVTETVEGVVTVVKPAVEFRYGNFIQTIIDFVIIAFCIFMFIRVIMKLKNAAEELKAKHAAEEAEKVANEEENAEEVLVVAEKTVDGMTSQDAADIKVLLEEIRDSLKAKSTVATKKKKE
jgi:large conductance mechanosensitive channel